MIFDFLKAYLFSQKANAYIKKMSWISFSGVAIGSFALVVVLAIMSGLNRSTEERLLKNEPHLVLSSTPQNRKALKAYFEKNLSIWGKDLQNSYPFEQQDVLVKTSQGELNGAEAMGIEYSDLVEKKSFYDSYGSPVLVSQRDFQDGKSILIGPSLALELHLVVGDKIEVFQPETILKSQTDLSVGAGQVFKIGGVLQTDGAGSEEERFIFYRRGKMFSEDSKSMVVGRNLFFENPRQSVERYKLLNVPNGLHLDSWKDRSSSLFTALKLEKMAMTLLLGLALVITSFSIMSLLILLIVQKQKDIGILLSMGLSKSRVRWLFGGIGSLLAFMGVALGVGCGALVSFLLDLHPLRILPDLYQDPYLPAEFSIKSLGLILFFCLLVSLLSSLVPVISLTNINTVKSLKGRK